MSDIPNYSENSKPNQATTSVLRLKDFVATPFQASKWEIIDKSQGFAGNFNPCDFEVVPVDVPSPDEMFDTFDDDSNKRWCTGSSKLQSSLEETSIQQEEQKRAKQLEEQYIEGKKAGYAEGYAEAEAKLQGELEALNQKVKIFTEDLNGKLQDWMKNVETQAFQLSLAVAKKLLETTKEAKPEYILDVIRQGLKSLGGARPLRIKVSEEDYEFIEVIGLPIELSPQELGISYIVDETIKSGCVIETDFGEVNLELDNMWRKIQSDLFESCD
jgi:flagellar biosynthesis/type III secretory pathway protein FliH